MQIFATANANVCNRGCKRLRPEIHTLICLGKCLLLTIFSDGDGHMGELFGAGFRIKNSSKTPVPAHLKWNKTAFIEVFSAQNGLNVQDFFSFGNRKPTESNYHIVSVSAILPALCHQAGQRGKPPQEGTEMPLCLIIHNISSARRKRRLV